MTDSYDHGSEETPGARACAVMVDVAAITRTGVVDVAGPVQQPGPRDTPFHIRLIPRTMFVSRRPSSIHICRQLAGIPDNPSVHVHPYIHSSFHLSSFYLGHHLHHLLWVPVCCLLSLPGLYYICAIATVIRILILSHFRIHPSVPVVMIYMKSISFVETRCVNYVRPAN